MQTNIYARMRFETTIIVRATEDIAHLKLRVHCHRSGDMYLISVLHFTVLTQLHCVESSVQSTCMPAGTKVEVVWTRTPAATAAVLYIRGITDVNTLTCLSTRDRQHFELKRIPSTDDEKQLC
jgi:hypothetical protein